MPVDVRFGRELNASDDRDAFVPAAGDPRRGSLSRASRSSPSASPSRVVGNELSERERRAFAFRGVRVSHTGTVASATNA